MEVSSYEKLGGMKNIPQDQRYKRYFIVFFEGNKILTRRVREVNNTYGLKDEEPKPFEDRLSFIPVRGCMPIIFSGYVNHNIAVREIENMGAQDVRITGINEITESDYIDFNAGK